LEHLDAKFGKEAPLSISQGKVHDYLGMVMDFSKPRQDMITMIDYTRHDWKCRKNSSSKSSIQHK
jgi:hypothetical protein